MALTKKGYTASFHFVGEVHITDDTFKIDNVSNSGYKYNRANFCIRCGNSGTHFVQAIGGYFTNKAATLRVGKREDGKFINEEIAWEDRFDDEIIESVFNTLRASVEKTQDGKSFVKKFLSEYDFVSYISEHISDGDIVSCRGDIEYGEYEGSVTTRYNLKSITKIDKDDVEREATFTQTVLMTSDCICDTDDDGYTTISGFGIDYDKEIRGNRAFPISFKYKFPEDAKKAKAQKKLLFNVKEGEVNAVTFLGEFTSSFPVVEATADDLTDDIKELIELGLYTEEEVLTQYAGNGRPTTIAVITKPRVYTPKDGSPTVQIVEGFCDESELHGVKVVESNPTSTPISTDDEWDLDSLFN